jgi:hypothetical protein
MAKIVSINEHFQHFQHDLRAKLKRTMRLKMAKIVGRQRIRNRQAIQQALDLRSAGVTYSQIARHLSLSTIAPINWCGPALDGIFFAHW